MEKELKLKIQVSTIIGCYDIVELYGGDTGEYSTETVISGVLDSLIAGLRDDNMIPTYTSEENTLIRLSDILEGVPIRTEKQDSGSDVVLKDILSGVQQLGTLKDLVSETKPLEQSALPPLPPVEKAEGEEPEVPVSFSDISETDPLAQEARGNERKEKLLSDLYSKLPRGQWGSERARSMWSVLLQGEAAQTS